MKPFTHAVLVVTLRDTVLPLVYMTRFLMSMFWQWFTGTLQHIPTGQRLTSMEKQGAQAGPFAFGSCPGRPVSGLLKKGITFYLKRNDLEIVDGFPCCLKSPW